MLLAADALGFEMMFDRRNRTQRNFLLAGGGVDVEILDVG